MPGAEKGFRKAAYVCDILVVENNQTLVPVQDFGLKGRKLKSVRSIFISADQGNTFRGSSWNIGMCVAIICCFGIDCVFVFECG
ncbi:unnamed protein product [Brassica rapa]|uniref:Uncharacterized protein n=2 Tax=Brassica TaxID=3705 RepID=A0A8D9MCE4_BRACM|nr:unnamed protein product [Brassica napus]CAG7904660.1 unnamed protein product [Brassica rapa]